MALYVLQLNLGNFLINYEISFLQTIIIVEFLKSIFVSANKKADFITYILFNLRHGIDSHSEFFQQWFYNYIFISLKIFEHILKNYIMVTYIIFFNNPKLLILSLQY